MTYGSLFSGIGGMDLGLDRAGMTCKWQVEINPFARRVLAKHWPDVPKHDDVKTFPPDDSERWNVDLIAGGFPCQDVSLNGKRAGMGEGTRSGLWSEFERIIRLLRPRFVIVENVPGLLSSGFGRVLGDLASLGFDAEWSSVSACEMGAPHMRQRMFVVAHAIGERWEWRGDSGESETEDGGSEGQSSGRMGRSNWSLETRPPIERLATRFPERVDSLRTYGNAVVPDVAEFVGHLLIAANGEAAR